MMPKIVETHLSQKGWCNYPTKVEITVYFNTDNFDAFKINRNLDYMLKICFFFNLQSPEVSSDKENGS